MGLCRLWILVCVGLWCGMAHATEVIPQGEVVTEFREGWWVKRLPASGELGELTAASRAESNAWIEGQAPFFLSSRKSKRKGTALALDSLSGVAKSDDAPVILLFTRDVEVERPEELESLLVEARFVGGFIVYLNGREVLRHRLDLEGQYQSFQASAEMPAFVREGRRSTSQRAFRGIDPSVLVAGTNTLSVEVHPTTRKENLYFDLRVEAFREPGFIKGPYLQRVSKDAITIMFETSSISTPYVEYGSGQSLTEVATVPSTGGTLHEVRLTGLEPGTRYFYRVRAEKIWPPLTEDEASSLYSRVYHFSTEPETFEPYTFLAYGDNRSQPRVHDAIVERMLAEKATFVLNTGDLTESGVDYRQWQKEFFEPAMPLMHYLPLWPSLGNHDGNHVSYFEVFSLPGNESWYSFTYGNTEFFALNTVYKMSRGSDQYDWFVSRLEASTARWKVAYFHHPAYSCTPSRLPGYGPVIKYMVPLFEQYGVDLVVAGHDHLYAHGEQNGVHYVITGGGGAWTYPTQVEPPNIICERVHHFSRIRVEEDALYLTAIDIDGREIDAFSIQK